MGPGRPRNEQRSQRPLSRWRRCSPSIQLARRHIGCQRRSGGLSLPRTRLTPSAEFGGYRISAQNAVDRPGASAHVRRGLRWGRGGGQIFDRSSGQSPHGPEGSGSKSCCCTRDLAEREGFEPSIRVTPDTAFPVRVSDVRMRPWSSILISIATRLTHSPSTRAPPRPA
jgi:hypothetical protein